MAYSAFRPCARACPPPESTAHIEASAHSRRYPGAGEYWSRTVIVLARREAVRLMGLAMLAGGHSLGASRTERSTAAVTCFIRYQISSATSCRMKAPTI